MDELIETVRLEREATQKISSLSGGRRRRILILVGGRIVADGSADRLARQVAASRHGDTPIRARTGRQVTQVPYTTPVDANAGAAVPQLRR